MITNALITDTLITNAAIDMFGTAIDMFGTAIDIDIDAAPIRNVSTDLASGTAGC